MQRTFPSPCGLAMQALRLAFMASALSHGDIILDSSVELPCNKLIPIAGGGSILQSQIDTHGLKRSASL